MFGKLQSTASRSLNPPFLAYNYAGDDQHIYDVFQDLIRKGAKGFHYTYCILMTL